MRKKFVEFKKVWSVPESNVENMNDIDEVKEEAIELYNEYADSDDLLVRKDNVERVADNYVGPKEKQEKIDEAVRQIEEIRSQLSSSADIEDVIPEVNKRITHALGSLYMISTQDVLEKEAKSPDNLF